MRRGGAYARATVRMMAAGLGKSFDAVAAELTAATYSSQLSKITGEAMTPEAYHLAVAPKMRSNLIGLQAKAEDAARIAVGEMTVRKAEAIGFRFPKSAARKNPGKYEHGVSMSAGQVRVSVYYEPKGYGGDGAHTKQGAELDTIKGRRKALCDQMTPTGARRFGAYVRARTGKTARHTEATLAPLHLAWLDLMAARCIC